MTRGLTPLQVRPYGYCLSATTQMHVCVEWVASIYSITINNGNVHFKHFLTQSTCTMSPKQGILSTK